MRFPTKTLISCTSAYRIGAFSIELNSYLPDNSRWQSKYLLSFTHASLFLGKQFLYFNKKIVSNLFTYAF